MFSHWEAARGCSRGGGNRWKLLSYAGRNRIFLHWWTSEWTSPVGRRRRRQPQRERAVNASRSREAFLLTGCEEPSSGSWRPARDLNGLSVKKEWEPPKSHFHLLVFALDSSESGSPAGRISPHPLPTGCSCSLEQPLNAQIKGFYFIT